jgi:hypothetical protein
VTGTPFGAPAGLLQRLTRGQVRVGDLVAAVEGLGTAPPEPGLQLTVEQGDVLLVEDGRRTRVPLEELADRMSRAHVRATPQGVTAALRSWLAHRPVSEGDAAARGIAVLDWADPGQTVLGWRVVVARGGTIAPWRAAPSTPAPVVHRIRSAALGRAHALPADLRLAGPVALWSLPGAPGMDTAVLVRPEELLAESAAAGLPMRDPQVVVTPHRPVACADAGVARRLGVEATEPSVTMPWRDLADLGWG